MKKKLEEKKAVSPGTSFETEAKLSAAVSMQNFLCAIVFSMSVNENHVKTQTHVEDGWQAELTLVVF